MMAANSAPFSNQGMASCTVCHGTDYKTGVGYTESCYTCHTTAPHPPAPWGVGSANMTVPRHDQTDVSNASACIACHAAGSAINTTLGTNPVTPAGPTTPPGCYNATMCHGSVDNSPS